MKALCWTSMVLDTNKMNKSQVKTMQLFIANTASSLVKILHVYTLIISLFHTLLKNYSNLTYLSHHNNL